MKIKIAPSLLDANVLRLGEVIAEVEEAGADLLHVDVGDGHFVPNLMFGTKAVEAIKRHASVPVDVHLMLTDPGQFAPIFVEAGADIVIFHIEAVEDPLPVIRQVKKQGAQCGLALKPATPPEALADVMGEIDCVLVMTVEPGFSGQSFMESAAEKIPALRSMAGEEKDIYVDGGIGPETTPTVVSSGANVLAAASAVFSGDRSPAEAIRQLRQVAACAMGENLRAGEC